MDSNSQTFRFSEWFILVLALIVYVAGMLGSGSRVDLPEFVRDLLSWPSVSKWFIAYSVLYFAGAVLLAVSVRPETTSASQRTRRVLRICGVFALLLGGLALYAVFDNLAFKLQA